MTTPNIHPAMLAGVLLRERQARDEGQGERRRRTWREARAARKARMADEKRRLLELLAAERRRRTETRVA